MSLKSQPSRESGTALCREEHRGTGHWICTSSFPNRRAPWIQPPSINSHLWWEDIWSNVGACEQYVLKIVFKFWNSKAHSFTYLLVRPLILRCGPQISTNVTTGLITRKIPGPHPRPTESEALGQGLSHLCFNKPHTWFWWQFENHWLKLPTLCFLICKLGGRLPGLLKL